MIVILETAAYFIKERADRGVGYTAPTWVCLRHLTTYSHDQLAPPPPNLALSGSQNYLIQPCQVQLIYNLKMVYILCLHCNNER